MTAIENINALVELEAAGIKYEPVGEDEVRVCCPQHDDETPSAQVNVRKNLWGCNAAGCKAKGDIISLIALHLGVERNTVLVQLSKRYDLDTVKQISADTVEKFHEKIADAGPLLTALRERGVTDAMIGQARIGYWNGRLTIPIKDASGRCRDVLRYLPGAPGAKKMQHTRGYSKLRLYREADLEQHDVVWVCGGPIKALVVGEMLKSHGVGAVCSSGGEGSWNIDWSEKFKGKKAFVCYDVDSHGVAAANRIAELLVGFADEVWVIQLPLDTAKYPKGDVNDFVGSENATDKELVHLMEVARPYQRVEVAQTVDRGPRTVKLRDVTQPSNVGFRLRTEAIAAAMDDSPYIVPKELTVKCDRAQALCHLCPIKRTDPDETGGTRAVVPPFHQAILSLAGSGESSRNNALRMGLNIPKCKSVEFGVLDNYRVTDVRLAPELTISGEGSGNTMIPALFVDCEIDLNTPYELQARLYPHPANQRATLIVDKVDETVDSLTSFRPSGGELDQLEVFRCESTVEAIEERLNALYTDLEANVTRIFERRDLHIAYDLAYHSPLLLTFNGRRINGWLNILVAGDSAQGKSETFIQLRDHYQLGERVECKNASVAGLLGGLQQLGTRWFVSWGAIPMHDRRLVALEEVKGASVEVIGKLTDMRSSGIAEIPKIERRRAHARTRLIFISNPRSSRQVGTYSFGVEAYQELIGSPEDLRRFDLALMVAAGQVDSSVIHEKREAEHTHTSELCRRLVLWAWTRDRSEVEFTDECVAAIRNISDGLTQTYSERIPLVDRGTVHMKVARLAAALAARLFNEQDGKLLVEEGHARYIDKYLRRQYDDPAVGYREYSRNAQINRRIDEVKVRRFISSSKYPRALLEGLLSQDSVCQQDLQDWCDADREFSATLLSYLVRARALRRLRRTNYAKTQPFIRLLRQLELEIPEDKNLDITEEEDL